MFRLSFVAACAVALACANARVSSAQPAPNPVAPTPTEPPAETIEVEGTAPAQSASSVHLGAAELARRPHNQPSDLLRQVPGLVVSQHAGGGKSDQYFIRGFDADHGTDVAVFLDGVPVNLTSHGHGQGYADTHWLIPETIGSVDMHKGPYAARYGDFYTAGALELRTIDAIAGARLYLTGTTPVAGPTAGERRDYRLVGMASPRMGVGKALVAAELGEADGPFVNPQNFRRSAALGKWTAPLGAGDLTLTTTFYTARWNQSGQLPAAEVDAGRLDRFDAIDPTEGGASSRGSLAASYTVDGDDDARWVFGAYAVGYRLRLYSNFTLFARDTVNGDQIEQTDARVLAGLHGAYTRPFRVGRAPGLVTVGVQTRFDDVETSLDRAAARVRLPGCDGGANPCNHTQNRIGNAAGYVEARLRPTATLELLGGVRLDEFTWDVDDLDPETALTPATTGGTAQAALVSPKLSAIVHATSVVDIFVNAGLGFHSNDARAAVASNGAGALARAWGGELGARVSPMPGLHASVDLWGLYLTSEQVWSGDAGGTEPSDPTRRYGLDVEAAFDVTAHLTLDANVAVGRATVVANAGNGGALALAPRLMGGGGVSYHDDRNAASLRVRGIGERPANDDGSLKAEGFLLVDVVASRRLGPTEVSLTIENVTNAAWREAQFAEESRVSPTAPLREDVHFTPGKPLTATLGVRVDF